MTMARPALKSLPVTAKELALQLIDLANAHGPFSTMVEEFFTRHAADEEFCLRARPLLETVRTLFRHQQARESLFAHTPTTAP